MKSIFLIPFILFQFFSQPLETFGTPSFCVNTSSWKNSTLNKAYGSQADVLLLDSIQEELSTKLLRLHVIAASDNKEDQQLKLLVKDKTVELLRDLLSHCSTKEEAMNSITKALPQLRQKLQNFLISINSPQAITVSLEHTYFPVKLYGDLIFPAGTYDSLQVVLEDGAGQNWWCVLYPPLCFTDLCTQSVPQESKQQLQTTLTKNTWNRLQTDTTTKNTSCKEQQQPKIRFWIVDFIRSLWD